MFEINDKVMYGLVGVCQVEDIAAPPIKGIDGKYYYLQPVFDDKGIVYSPVDNKNVPMRLIMTKEECEKLHEIALNCKDNEELNEKIPVSQYDEMIKSLDANKLLHLIRHLYNAKNIRIKELRKMKSIDARTLNSAKKLLYSEISVSSEMNLEDVEREYDELLSVL